MGKLTPKEINKQPKSSWNELNAYIVDGLNIPNQNHVFVHPDLYQMSREEIISELKIAGYDVEEFSDHLVVR